MEAGANEEYCNNIALLTVLEDPKSQDLALPILGTPSKSVKFKPSDMFHGYYPHTQYYRYLISNQNHVSIQWLRNWIAHGLAQYEDASELLIWRTSILQQNI